MLDQHPPIAKRWVIDSNQTSVYFGNGMDCQSSAYRYIFDNQRAYVRSRGFRSMRKGQLFLSALCTLFTMARAQAAGPSFDCAKADQALPIIICSDPDLSQLDLQFSEAYQALRLQVGSPLDKLLRQEAIDFQRRTYEVCKLPIGPATPGLSSQGFNQCISSLYNQQRAEWLNRLNGAGREEAMLPIGDYVIIQQFLIARGFLPSSSIADGVFGTGTRDAIKVWQSSQGHVPTGFIDQDDAAGILALVGHSQPPAPSQFHSEPSQPAPSSGAEQLAIAQAAADKAKADALKAQAEQARAEAEAKRAESERAAQEMITARQQAADEAAARATAAQKAKTDAEAKSRQEAEGSAP